MAKIFTKIFLWFFSLIFAMSIYSGFVLAENSTIIRPESSFVPDINFFDEEGNKVAATSLAYFGHLEIMKREAK